MKDENILRLELLAILIGVKAANVLLRELEMIISKRILCFDSQFVYIGSKQEYLCQCLLKVVLRRS